MGIVAEVYLAGNRFCQTFPLSYINLAAWLSNIIVYSIQREGREAGQQRRLDYLPLSFIVVPDRIDPQ